MRTHQLVGLLVTILLFVANSGGATQSPNSSPKKASRSNPNVILITVDTLRADRVGPPGAGSLTPNIDALAGDGAVFSNAIAQVPLTLPSHTTILTGIYPMSHGVRDLSTAGVPAGVRTLATMFKARGYKTAAFVSAFALSSNWGLNRGFDHYDDRFSEKQDFSSGRLERPAQETLDGAMAWLRNPRSGNLFLWIHLYDPHAPYEPPEPFRSLYRTNPYDGEVAYVDAEVGKFIAFLKERNLYSSSVILLTSDHGEALGEHGEQQHGFFVYNSTVHVPLILKPAGQKPAQSQDASIAGLVDIAPTLAGLAHLPVAPGSFQGRNLLSPTAERNPGLETGYAESLYPRSSFGWHSLHSVQNERYHYIDAGHSELYDLSQDPGELRNIIEEKPSVAAVLKDELHSVLARYPPTLKKSSSMALNIESSKQLQALGYLRGSPQPDQIADTPNAPDPKEKIDVFNEILRTTELTQDGKFQESSLILQRLANGNRGMFLLPYLQGENLLSSGAAGEAMPYYRRALELNPRYSLAAIGLGHAASRAGDDAEAEKAYQAALALNPHDSLVRLALAKTYQRLNRLADAAREQRTVLLADPDNSRVNEDYAGTLISMNQSSKAVPILQRVIASSNATTETFSLLGNAYVHGGKFREAVGAYKQAIGLDPNYAQAYFSLALIYYKLQDQTNFHLNHEKGCQLDVQLCRTLDSKIR